MSWVLECSGAEGRALRESNGIRSCVEVWKTPFVLAGQHARVSGTAGARTVSGKLPPSNNLAVAIRDLC